MTHTELRPETFGKQMRRVWRENKGNWLLATGLIVSAIACGIGYFDLLPEFSAVRRPSSNVWSGGKKLTVHILGCDGDRGRVVAMLYDAVTFNESSVPARLETLTIKDGRADWEVNNLAYGNYAVYAFQDLDGNEIVDPKVERQGITMTSSIVPSTGPSGFNFSSAAFEFSPAMTEVTVELR